MDPGIGTTHEVAVAVRYWMGMICDTEIDGFVNRKRYSAIYPMRLW